MSNHPRYGDKRKPWLEERYSTKSMDARQRTLACLREEPIDRIPVVHFGFWKDTLLKWAAEGHISSADAHAYADGNKVDARLCEQLGFDHCWTPAVSPDTYLRPAFEERVVRELADGSRHVLNHEGVVELDLPGTTSIRSTITHTLVDRESWETHYKWRLQWTPGRTQHLENWAPPQQPRPVGLWCGSLVGNIRNILGVEGMAYLGEDDPELLDEIVDTIGGLSLKCVRSALEHVPGIDFGHFWEDICYNHGPLVNPRFFVEKIGPWYRRITDVLHKAGIGLVSVDCDGKIDTLIPHWLETGVNVMFPIEVGTWQASLQPWRALYGRRIKGVGGLRKHVLAEDRAAVDAEIERLKPLIAGGGYVPCPDHRLAPETDWDLVRYYTEALKAVRF